MNAASNFLAKALDNKVLILGGSLGRQVEEAKVEEQEEVEKEEQHVVATKVTYWYYTHSEWENANGRTKSEGYETFLMAGNREFDCDCQSDCWLLFVRFFGPCPC